MKTPLNDMLIDMVTVRLQIVLNKRIYEMRRIAYDRYQKANDILLSKLAKLEKQNDKNK